MPRVSYCLVASALMTSLIAGFSPVVRAQTPAQGGAPAQSAPPSTAASPSAAATLTLSPGDAARGAYIVEEVAQCGRCHSPVTRTGERDRSRWLMGGPLDFAPTVAPHNWAMAAPRIASTPPGTDEQFVHLLMTGISRTGQPPMRPMPQFHMSQADAEAVLAYLKSLPARRGTE